MAKNPRSPTPAPPHPPPSIPPSPSSLRPLPPPSPSPSPLLFLLPPLLLLLHQRWHHHLLLLRAPQPFRHRVPRLPVRRRCTASETPSSDRLPTRPTGATRWPTASKFPDVAAPHRNA